MKNIGLQTLKENYNLIKYVANPSLSYLGTALIDISAEDIVANNIIEVLQRNKGQLRIYVSKCFWHCRIKRTNELQELLTTLHSEKTLGLSLSFSGLHNKLVRETLPGIIRLENLTSLDLSTNLLDFVSPADRFGSRLAPSNRVAPTLPMVVISHA